MKINREDPMNNPPYGKHDVELTLISEDGKQEASTDTNLEFRVGAELDPKLENLTEGTQTGKVGETQTFEFSADANARLEFADLGPNYTVSGIQYIGMNSDGTAKYTMSVTPNVEGKYSITLGTPRSTTDAWQTQSITLNGEAIDVTKLPVTVEMVPEKTEVSRLDGEFPILHISGENLENIRDWEIEAIFTEPIRNITTSA